MLDDPLRYGLLAALAIALLAAAITDIRSRRITNRLNAAIALGAPPFWWASGMALWPDVAWQLGVTVATFAVLCPLFAIRAIGGGDVKLLTALALWIAPGLFAKLVIMMAIVGGVLTLALIAWRALRRRRERIEVPYGVAIALAALWVLGSFYLPGPATAPVLG